jgi:hypothetical protein
MFCFTVCGAGSSRRGARSVPVGTDAATGKPDVAARGIGAGGIDRDHRIGTDPGFPGAGSSGRR